MENRRSDKDNLSVAMNSCYFEESVMSTNPAKYELEGVMDIVPPDYKEVVTRCQFVEGARRCTVNSTLYPYCAEHLRQACGLEVRTSTVPRAGLGLFYVGLPDETGELQALKKGTVVTEYSGDTSLTEDEYDDRYPMNDSAYGLCVAPNTCLDSGSTDNYPGRYINHRAHSRANVRWGRKLNRMSCGKYAVSVYATKRIKPGSELFIDYGPMYWRLSPNKPS